MFEQLANVRIHTTDLIATDLVLQINDKTHKAQSDRLSLLHAIVNGQLRIFFPEDPTRLRISCRSQLPRLVATITASEVAAIDDISNIISCSIDELEDVLTERDITDVSWITKPVIDLNEFQELEPSEVLGGASRNDSAEDTYVYRKLSSDSNGASLRSRGVSVTSVDHHRHSQSDLAYEAQQARYQDLIEQLICVAHGETNEDNGYFDNTATFGSPIMDISLYNRRIGAAGEVFVSSIYKANI